MSVTKFQFPEHRCRVDSVLSEAVQLIENNEELLGHYLDRVYEARDILSSDGKLRVTLLGEYNAGKSSLIKALTGQDIGIDADVETTTTEIYDWKGVELVDTPGVQAEANRSKHDKIAEEATIDSDLIIFVVTAAGFNSRLAEHFHYVAGDEGLGLASKMMVVMNKIDQDNAPVENLVADVEQTISPYHDEMTIQPAAVGDYLDADDAKPAIRKKLIERSNVSQLSERINKFIESSGALGRLLRPLQNLEAVISDTTDELTGEDSEIQDELESLRRTRYTVREELSELKSKKRTWKSKVRETVLTNVDDISETAEELSNKEELEEEFELEVNDANRRLEEVYEEVQQDLRQWMTRLQEKINSVNEDLDTAAEQNLRDENVEPDPSFKDKPYSGVDLFKFTDGLTDELIAPMLKELAEEPGWLKDATYKIGKKMGKNFKPWEAVNKSRAWSKVFGRASKALPFLKAGLELFLQYREEKKIEERQKHKAKMRLMVQREFRELADAQANALEESLDKIEREHFQQILDRVDERESNLRSEKIEAEGVAEELNELRRESTKLRHALSDDA